MDMYRYYFAVAVSGGWFNQVCCKMYLYHYNTTHAVSVIFTSIFTVFLVSLNKNSVMSIISMVSIVYIQIKIMSLRVWFPVVIKWSIFFWRHLFLCEWKGWLLLDCCKIISISWIFKHTYERITGEISAFDWNTFSSILTEVGHFSPKTRKTLREKYICLCADNTVQFWTIVIKWRVWKLVKRWTISLP